MYHTIGCDPEAFVIDANGKTVPAPLLERMRGTKAAPFPVPYGAIQVDGLAVEFNILPARTLDEWRTNIAHVIRQLRAACEPYLLSFEPVRTFDDDVLKALSKEHFILGCDIDFNAWNEGRPNRRPKVPRNIRTTAGHIHIGFEEDFLAPSEKAQLVRHLDHCLLVPSMTWDKKNKERQKYYGKPGSFRPKPYGLEYRALSSVWLNHPELIDYVFMQTQWAVNQFFGGVIFDGYSKKGKPTFNIESENDIAEVMSKLAENGAPKCPSHA